MTQRIESDQKFIIFTCFLLFRPKLQLQSFDDRVTGSSRCSNSPTNITIKSTNNGIYSTFGHVGLDNDGKR